MKFIINLLYLLNLNTAPNSKIPEFYWLLTSISGMSHQFFVSPNIAEYSHISRKPRNLVEGSERSQSIPGFPITDRLASIQRK